MKCVANESLQKLIIALCFMMITALPTLAQVTNVTVRGKITNETGQPVPRASIIVKGGTAGTSSDEAGNFQISAPANGTLVI
jgi:uncharacterized GH25 family protein